jgi:hypothetical protein
VLELARTRTNARGSSIIHFRGESGRRLAIRWVGLTDILERTRLTKCMVDGRQMRKLACNILAVVQQYDALRNSEARGGIIGNSKMFLELKLKRCACLAGGEPDLCEPQKEQPQYRLTVLLTS